jgi:hypothetical protein
MPSDQVCCSGEAGAVRAGALRLGEQQAGDQESGEDEERVHAQEPAGQPVGAGVEDHDSHDSECPDPVEGRLVTPSGIRAHIAPSGLSTTPSTISLGDALGTWSGMIVTNPGVAVTSAAHDRRNFPEVVASARCYGHSFREVVPIFGCSEVGPIKGLQRWRVDASA